MVGGAEKCGGRAGGVWWEGQSVGGWSNVVGGVEECGREG